MEDRIEDNHLNSIDGGGGCCKGATKFQGVEQLMSGTGGESQRIVTQTKEGIPQQKQGCQRRKQRTWLKDHLFGESSQLFFSFRF
ncbi:hypothetical protein GCM10007416_03070 [Kroppenstedtia guangzhouensis]|uniref:Uncharacterized protein n=1 Tax=Kroppenstedtia guangzhouensis TaxID=1274356 RepID=A0ABQ1FY18_9BACL|nr:hypothetical protein GCM10007416_03070 [Kroppenstedtia guangzhouensis]